MKLFKNYLAAAIVVASFGLSQSASATILTYIADGNANVGTFNLIAPHPQRPTWYNVISAVNLQLTVDDVTRTASINGIVNFNTYTLTSNPANNAAGWINASDDNYTINTVATGLNIANNAAGNGQFVAAFYGASTSTAHTSDLALYGANNQNWCFVPGSCSPTGGPTGNQYIGAWGLVNPSFANLAFGLTNIGNGNFQLVAWYKAMGHQYQVDFNGIFRLQSGPPGPPIPEPASVALLASGVLPLLRRRMKKA